MKDTTTKKSSTSPVLAGLIGALTSFVAVLLMAAAPIKDLVLQSDANAAGYKLNNSGGVAFSGIGAATTRTNLALGTSATRNVGTTAGTVADGEYAAGTATTLGQLIETPAVIPLFNEANWRTALFTVSGTARARIDGDGFWALDYFNAQDMGSPYAVHITPQTLTGERNQTFQDKDGPIAVEGNDAAFQALDATALTVTGTSTLGAVVASDNVTTTGGGDLNAATVQAAGVAVAVTALQERQTLYAIKTADEDRTNTTTWANDSDLVISVPAAGTYHVRTNIQWATGSATPGASYIINITGATASFVGGTITNSSNGSSLATANLRTYINNSLAGDLTNYGSTRYDLVVTVNNAANFTFQWAQGTTSAAYTRLLQGSWMSAQPAQ